MDETTALNILHLEDDPADAELIHRTLARERPACHVQVITRCVDFLKAVENGGFQVVLSDSRLPDIDALEALHITRRYHPGVPFLFVSGQFDTHTSIDRLKASGAAECLLKSDLSRLGPAIRRALSAGAAMDPAPDPSADHPAAMERLVAVVQELSLARHLDAVMAIVRRSARELTGADGATFVLRDGDHCYYADEDAISPLWKGQRFPLDACISGWVMENRRQAVIEDIYADPRIPHDAYRPTFVKSLVMVPIRTLAPVGAIGNYWARHHRPTAQQVRLLQALADTTAVAMENVNVYSELERRVADRTTQLQATNKELETFAYAVSHDLRAPLRHIEAFSKILHKEHRTDLNDDGLECLERIRHAVGHMHQLIEDLLNLSRATQATVTREDVDLSQMSDRIMASLRSENPQRPARVKIAEGLTASGDPRLLEVVMNNLLSNAWKYTAKTDKAHIEVGRTLLPDDGAAYYVRDNGAGFDQQYAERAFKVFQRLHSAGEFPGTGIGLATVQRIIEKHGGRIWVETKINEGATFFFTLA